MSRSFVSLCCYLGLICEIFLVPAASSLSTCPKIHLENGTVKRRGRGKVVRFFCLRGFSLAGERYTTCIHGKWDPDPPKCVRPTCKDVQPSVDNLFIYPTHGGAVQHFFCKGGYVLRGARDIYCNGFKWSDNMPSCLLANEKPKLSCDFETTDLCGWTHDLNHDFDWRRENFNTPSGSIGTGPSFDHTKGRGQSGYYMYIESSSRRENDTARLISPIYNKINESVCFEFYYHMFGATIGTLRVYLKTVDQSWNLQPNSSFFIKKGNQGDKWYRSYHDLGNIKNDFQIIIEGVRGNGYISDIAIDDVKIIPGCTAEDESTTTMDSSTYNEMFPTVDSCENRCDQKENETTNMYHLTCDCDQDCAEDHRCCPDFYDFCAGVTGYGDSSTIDAITPETYTTKGLLISMPPVTQSSVLKKMPTTKSTTTIPKLTTTLYRATKVTKMAIPTIYLKTQPVTPAIYRKTIPTTKKPTTTTKKPTTTTKPTTTAKPTTTTVISKKILVTTQKNNLTSKSGIINTSKQSVTLNIVDAVETEVSDDVIAVPKPTNNDEPLYDGISASKENWSDELENSLDFPYPRNFSESNKLFSQVQEQPKSHFLVITVGLCVAIVSISVVVFVVIKRYRFSRRKIRSSNGESQSDVRYLTGDEILDLSLANNDEELLLS